MKKTIEDVIVPVETARTVKRIVQAIAVCFGLVGLTWVVLGIRFVVMSLRQVDLFLMLFMTPSFILLGGILIAVAWQTLRHFGPKAIRKVIGLVAFSVYSGMSALLLPNLEKTPDFEKEPYLLATVFVPMIFAYLLYRLLSRKLIQLTDIESIQQEDPTSI